MKADDVKRHISQCAAKSRPFLFGFDFEMEHGFFVPDPMNQTEILFRTPLGGNYIPRCPARTFSFAKTPISYREYKAAFDVISAGLHRGDSYLTNLTVQTPINTDLSLEEILLGSNAPYGLLLPGRLVCFSPECFVSIDEHGVIATHPMKGTISASIPNAEQHIMNDAKERDEHNTVVDLLRNDIGIVAEEVRVSRFRYVTHVVTNQGEILQVSSEVIGKLHDNYRENLGEIICAMLPAGSVSGAPKQATLQLIARAEQRKRGYYTGVFGYFDGRRLDSAVMIRYIEEVGGCRYFRSGGGITVNSDPYSEYQEVIDKVYLPVL